MIEIVNNQRKIRISTKNFEEFAENAVRQISEIGEALVVIAFVSDKKMRRLNKDFRAKDSTTDVLSFPFAAEEFEQAENTLGDIFISLEQAERQALENKLDLETEIKQLILHGVLHLCGFDHETDSGEMNALELEFREKLGI